MGAADVLERATPAPLATVIGKNAHQLRTSAGRTLDQVSIAARKHGLNWSESRVADFESGRVAPNLATLIAVCLALADAGCADATLPKLLASESPIQINDSLLLSKQQVVNLLSGIPWSYMDKPEEWVNQQLLLHMPIHMPTTVTSIEAPGATEERTWKALGLSPAELADWSAALWNRSFSQERDRRAGEGANPQKRGQVSRQMRKELQAAIEAATHGDDK
jgi:transcriptional regulator with XRE-family HTH domain